MRGLICVLILGCLVAGGAYGQRGGGRGGSSGGHAGGGMRGGGGFSGGGMRSGGGTRAGGFSGSGMRGGGFRGGSGFAGGNRGFSRGGFSFRGRGFRGGFYGYPAYWGGFGYGYGYSPWYFDSYYDSPGYAYAEPYPYYPPAVNVVSDYAPEPSYPREYPREPVREYPREREYTRPPSDATDYSPLYLIAFKDHLIRPAVAYWTEGATLHYVTMERQTKTVEMASVDRELSERLNRERRVAFSLSR